MGMLFFRVPATTKTRNTYAANLDTSAQKYLGWPCMAPDNYSVCYIDSDGTEWACPGNGDVALTEILVERIAADYAHTHMDVFFRESGDIHGMTLVVKEGP